MPVGLLCDPTQSFRVESSLEADHILDPQVNLGETASMRVGGSPGGGMIDSPGPW